MENIPPSPGPRLRQLRERFGLTVSDVVRRSEGIAEEQGDSRFQLSLEGLHWIETTGRVPTIHNLHCLARIYGLTLSQVLGWYFEDHGPGI